MTNTSTLTQHQVRTYGPKAIRHCGRDARITVEVRYDDRCGNGHNTFSITATIEEKLRNGRWIEREGGCLHEDIAKHFPDLAPLIRWHLVSSDGPMHYIANTLYWLGYSGFCDGKPTSPPNLEHARNAACWPDMPASFLKPLATMDLVTLALNHRLPALLTEFRAAVESLGFTW